MYELTLVLFAVTAGFTASAIAANLYRVSGAKADSDRGRTIRLIVMSIAGPSVIFETAMQGYLSKQWTPITFGLATAGVCYWSLVIGLLILDIVVHTLMVPA
jgi:hypothetical protein